MSINTKNINVILKNLEHYTSTRFMIVTKNQTIKDIEDLVRQGFKLFGENRVQEAEQKYLSLNSHINTELHLIGPLQRNKVKNALKIFDVIQTIDRNSLVDEIAKQLNKSIPIKTNKFFIQVNIGDERQKSGVLKENLQDFYNYAIDKKLNIDGFMCIPPNVHDPSNYFKEMIELRDRINKGLKLSMGMSNDYKIAIKHQSDMIRIGSLIFQ